MFCPECGKQIDDDFAFCDGCGADMRAFLQPAAPVIPAQEELPQPVQAEPIPVAPPVQPEPVVMPANEPITVPEPPIPVPMDQTLVFPVPETVLPIPEAPAPVPMNGIPAPVAPIPENAPQPITPQPIVPTPPIAPPPPRPQPPKPQPPRGKPTQAEAAAAGSNGSKTLITVLIAIACTAILVVSGFFLYTLIWGDSTGSDDKDDSSSVEDGEEEEDQGKNDKETVTLDEDNLYFDCFEDYKDYVLPESNQRYYAHQEIGKLSTEYLQVAVQELYARYGGKTDDKELQAYFEAREWYEKKSGAINFNDYEQANLLLLQTCIAQREGKLNNSRNPYISYLPTGSGLQPYSNSRYLTAADLANKNETQLFLIRSEIYARRGCMFKDTNLQEFFYCQDWYVPSVAEDRFNESTFNDYETTNLTMIGLYERKAKGVTFSADNPYRNIFYKYTNYVIANSNVSAISPYTLQNLSADELCIARNEILARHGYTFTDEQLLEYFLQRSWYEPSSPPGDSVSHLLTSTEVSNVDFLKSYETNIAKMPDIGSLSTGLTITKSTSLYSLKIPTYWGSYATVTQNGNSLSFYETSSKATSGGHIFTISAFSDASAFEYMPSYDLLGYLEDAEGNLVYYIVALYPTDVQSEPWAMELYGMMRDEDYRIFDSITPASGYSYISY